MHILFEMNKGFYIGMVMIDLQNAVDIVDHDILPYNLEHSDFMMYQCHGWNLTWKIEIRRLKSTVFFLIPERLFVEYRRGPFWDHYCFSFM